MFAAADRVWIDAFTAGLEPDPDLLVSDWAAEHVRLPTDVSARPGPWDNALLPFGREIMDVLSPSNPTRHVVFMKSAQVGGTALATNWLLFIACMAAGPAMVIQPSIDLARAFSAEKLGPTIDATPVAKRRVTEQKSRDGGSATRFKRFPGGFLVLTGANSAAGLRQRSIRYMLKDDLDGWPDEVDGEGDPSALANKRTESYWNAKVFEVSTPTIKGFSKIEKAFLASDQRFFHVPCPHAGCGHMQRLVWDRVRWTPGQPETAVYSCPECGADIPHAHKPGMLAKGAWVATEPGPGKAAGFHVSALYSPFVSWADLARKYEASEGDPKARKAFTNTDLGEAYEEAGEAPPWEQLRDRPHGYQRNSVPLPVCFLTAGADVQGDRIEVEIVGWAPGEVSYSIDYRVLWGDTADADSEAWRQLSALYDEQWYDERGAALQLDRIAIDEGYRTPLVQKWVRGKMRAIAIKGDDGWKKPILGRRTLVQVKTNGRAIKGGHSFFPIGTWPGKRDIYDRLGLAMPTDGVSFPKRFCHFPAGYPDEFWKGLTAEVLVGDADGGGALRWKKTGRNEPLDCRLYALAAAYHAGMDKLSDAAWTALAADRAVAAPPAQADFGALWGAPVDRVAAPAPADQDLDDGDDVAPAPPAAPIAVAPAVAAREVANKPRRGVRGRVSL